MTMRRSSAAKLALGIAAAILGLLELGTDVPIITSVFTWFFTQPQSSDWDFIFQLIRFGENVCNRRRRTIWDYVFRNPRPPEYGYVMTAVCYIYHLVSGSSPEDESGLLQDIGSWSYSVVNSFSSAILLVNSELREVRHSLREMAIHLLLSLHYVDIMEAVSMGLGLWVLIRWVFYCRTKGLVKKMPKATRSFLTTITSDYLPVKLIHTNTNLYYFHAKCKKTDRDVFVKCLRKGCSQSTKKKLDKEYLMVSAISHPGIINVIDWIQIDAAIGLGLEFAPFGNLRDAMFTQFSQIRGMSKFIIFRQVVAAVEFLHDVGMAHLNIRPGSVMVFKKWSLVKLSGFDHVVKVNPKRLCRLFDLHAISTPPEVFKRKPYHPKKADIWALGSLFFYIMTGDYLQKDTGLPLDRLVFPCLKDCDWDDKRGVLEILNCALFPVPHRRPEASQLMRRFRFFGL